MVPGRAVVVGVDGSEGSHAAVRWAAPEAVRRGLPLRLVHAAVPTHLPTMRSFAATATADWRDAARKVAGDGVDTARRAEPTLAVEPSVYLNQSPAQALTGEAGSAELLVLGARGNGGFGALTLGSTAIQVLQLATSPVVVVREPDPATTPGSAAGQVVVGVDGSVVSRLAARFAFGEAAARGVGLTVVHAWSKPWHPALRSVEVPTDWPLPEADSASMLAESIAVGREDFPAVAVTDRLVEGRPAEALVDLSGGAELLVVGSRGRGGLAGLVLGSVSHAVVHRAQCPVAVVR